MVASLRNDFIEAFENQDDEEFSVGHYLDKFQNSDGNTTPDLDSEAEAEEEDDEEVKMNSKSKFQDTNNIESENVEGENVEGENVEGEDTEIMSNNSIVEGFNGSKVIELNNEKIWLKSIMFGLLFYILSNPKIYDLTKGLSSQVNKHVLHTLIFVVITYFLLIIA
tara:strand:- start:61 stop:558 length:498 start_codon:yes stop_codon:yes gene_type:complete